MKRFFLAFLVFPVFVPLHAEYFPHIGNGIANGVMIQTEFICLNAGVEVTQVTVEFFSSGRDEEPLDLPIEEHGLINMMAFSLGKGESYQFRTTGQGPLTAGFAKVTGSAKTSVVFSGTNPTTGQVLFEVGVPATSAVRDPTIYVDSMGVRDVGVAMLNTSDAPANLRLRLYDTAFRPLGVLDRTLYVREHRAELISEIFKAVPRVCEMTGVLTIDTDRPVTFLPLRQNASTLTSLRIITGRADLWTRIFSDDFDIAAGPIEYPPSPWIDVSSTVQKATACKDSDKRSIVRFSATEKSSQPLPIAWERRWVHTSTDWNLEFLARDATGVATGSWSVGLGQGTNAAPEGDWVELCSNGTGAGSVDGVYRKQGENEIKPTRLRNRDSGYHRFQIMSDNSDVVFIIDLVEVGRIKGGAFAPSRIVVGVTNPPAELQIDWVRYEIN